MTASSKKKIAPAGEEEKEEVVDRRPSSLQVKNIHYIKSPTRGYLIRQKIPQPRRVPSKSAAATVNSSDRIAHRKMAAGPVPKVAVDMKKIIENLQEKQTMRNQVALIGAGGRSPSAPLATQKSSFKSASSGHHVVRRLKSAKNCETRRDLGSRSTSSSSSCSNNSSYSRSPSGCSPQANNRSKSQLSSCGSSSNLGHKYSSSIDCRISSSSSSTCSTSRHCSSNLQQAKGNLTKKKQTQSSSSHQKQGSMVINRNKSVSSPRDGKEKIWVWKEEETFCTLFKNNFKLLYIIATNEKLSPFLFNKQFQNWTFLF